MGANKLLAKEFPQLQTLSVSNCFSYLDYNNISAAGMSMMPDSKMGQLQELKLCTLFITQH